MAKLKNLIQPIARRTRSNKPLLVKPIKDIKKVKKHWVSATQLRNHILKDGLVDWLDVYNGKTSSNSTRSMTFPNFLLNKGNEFEEKVMDYISNNHKVEFVSTLYNKSSIDKTVRMMKEGVPLIYSSPLSNKKNNTYGVADLLVRSDYLKKLINNVDIDDEELSIPSPKLNLPCHYLVIDIKFFTLPLRCDGKHILNTDKTRAYKSQLYIYNDAIGEIQGYTPRYSFLLGRSSKHISKGETYKTETCLDKMGIVDFEDVDNFCVPQTIEAIKWRRRVLNEGVYWDINEINQEELFPNMKVNSLHFQKIKEKIADELGEITMLWRCGVKERQNAFYHNVFSWKDPKCNADILGVSDGYKETVNAMIKMNRDSEEVILPRKINNNLGNWKEFSQNEMFVDFETISDICEDFDSLPERCSFNIIYMIGIGWMEGNVWKHKTFICNTLDLQEENRIMNDFYNFVQSRGNPKLHYWCAEERFWKSSRKKQQNMIIQEDISDNDMDWLDLCNVFRKEPVVIKGVFGFGLKNIAKKMKEYGMIDISMESDCKDGMMAMVKSWFSYKGNRDPSNSAIMKDIQEYNQFDCRSLQEILYYIREKHI